MSRIVRCRWHSCCHVVTSLFSVDRRMTSSMPGAYSRFVSLAAIFWAELGDVTRFASAKQVTPRQD